MRQETLRTRSRLHHRAANWSHELAMRTAQTRTCECSCFRSSAAPRRTWSGRSTRPAATPRGACPEILRHALEAGDTRCLAKPKDRMRHVQTMMCPCPEQQTACVRRAPPCRDSGHQGDSVRAARALASGEGRLTSPTPGCRRPWKIKNVYPGLANTGCKHTVLTMIACICEHIPLRTHPQRRLPPT